MYFLAGCMRNKSIILLEAAPDKQITVSGGYSNRVAALAPSSVKLLSQLGVWDMALDMGADRIGQVS